MKRLLILILLALPACAGTRPEGGVPLRIAVSQEPLVIKEIPLETYLVGVLSQEIHADWPLEAIKAQAIAARTYALYRKGHPRSPQDDYDLEASTQDQLFLEQKSYSPPLVQAVQETKGMILQYEGQVLPAFFHSSCGGISEKASSVWPEDAWPPLNQIHEDPYCEAAPRSHWSYETTREELGGQPLILERYETGRIETLLLQSPTGDRELSGNAFRQQIGYEKIRSTLFDIEETNNRIKFVGRGSGHGVGLCQWGAKGMAEQGHTYIEILEFYYPGAELKK